MQSEGVSTTRDCRKREPRRGKVQGRREGGREADWRRQEGRDERGEGSHSPEVKGFFFFFLSRLVHLKTPPSV